MIDTDLRYRVQRLLRGERRPDDLDRIFLGLRERSYEYASVREIGDFVAHRDQREKGPVTQKVRDVCLSLLSWLEIRQGCPFDLAHIRKVAAANLRNATDSQLKTRLGLSRNAAKSKLERALRKAEKGKDATQRERLVVDYLGGAFIWNPAFTTSDIICELSAMLVKTGLMQPAEVDAFRAIAPFLALYVITLMHGSAVILEDGNRVKLIAGFFNRQGQLEVKAQLVFHDLGKPVFAPICMFWTELLGIDHCTEPLASDPSAWLKPLEIGADGKLALLG